MHIPDDQREMLETGRAIASMEQTKGFKALMKLIDDFAADSKILCRSALSDSSVETTTYMRLSIRRDAAEELGGAIREWITHVKQVAMLIAEELQAESEQENQ